MARRGKYTPENTWWSLSGEKYTDDTVHSRLFKHARALEQDQADIHFQNLLNARLYSNRDLLAMDWDGNSSVSFRPLNANLENVIASVIDTKIALIGKNRPKATPIARNADFEIFLRTRLLDRFLYGEFVAHKIWNKANQCYADAEVYGTGVLKIELDKTQFCVFTERVNPDEIVVDQRECMSCDMPQQIIHRKLVSRMWLLQTFGDTEEKRDAILKAQTKGFEYTTYRAAGEEQVIILESWRLPTAPGSGDGRHAICIENYTFVDESYTRDRFPFVFLRTKPPMSGFYGRSQVEDLMGYQIRLNELNEVIRIGQDVVCVPRVFVQQGTGIVKTQLDNSIGKIITVRGDIPTAQTWNAFTPEIYNERDRIRSSAFEFAGISQLSAQAKLPTQARLDSSEALREYNAIENERFAREAQAFEDFHIEIAEHMVELYAELYKNQKVNKSQFFRSKYIIQQINWSDIALEQDQYVFQIGASSILNMSPAARKDKLNEWAAAGVIGMDEYKAYSGEPDLEKMTDMMSAPMDYAMYAVDKMLQGEPQVPDQLGDPELCLKVVSATYQHLCALETPEEVLQLFVNYMMLCKELLAPTPDPAALPVDGAGGMMPAGAPVDPMAMDPAGAGLPTPPMAPELGGPINTVTGAPAPSISSPAATAFLT